MPVIKRGTGSLLAVGALVSLLLIALGVTSSLAANAITVQVTAPTGVVEGTAIPSSTQIATFQDTGADAAVATAQLFTATINWGDGTTPSTGTVGNNGNGGGFTVSGGHTYAEDSTGQTGGTYTITVSISDTDQDTGSGTAAESVADAGLTYTAEPSFTPAENVAFTNQPIATITDLNPSATASDFSGTITWGDGTPATTATITGNTGGPFTVMGSHTYAAEEGQKFSPYATITDKGGNAASGIGTPTGVTVADGAITVAKNSFSVVENRGVTGQLVATFTDADPTPDSTDFSAASAASINWGDGNTSNGTIALANPACTSSCTYNVTGSHTYTAEEGSTKNVVATITDAGGAQGSDSSTPAVATIQDAAPLVGAAAGTSAVEGTALTGQLVATFTDPNPTPDATDFSAASAASINWGDGNTSNGTIAKADSNCSASCVYDVTGTHTYAEEGSDSIKVTITDAGGASGNDNGSPMSVTVGDAALAVSSPGNLSATEGAAFASSVVATFTDNNPTPDANDFPPNGGAAVVNWGDGSSTTNGTIAKANGSCTSSCVFNVTAGPHTYAEEGAFAIKVTVTDAGGATANNTTTINVADAAITVTAGSGFNVPEGAGVTNQLVATFTDAYAKPDSTDFSASGAAKINWGDGTTATNGTIALANPACTSACTYNVTGSHAYASTKEEGTTFNVSVTVTDAGGASGNDSATPAVATISDAAITVNAVAQLSVAENASLPTTVVATFTDANPAPDSADFACTGNGAPSPGCTVAAARINWGDGNTTNGTITGPNAQGVYSVSGSHTYASSIDDGTTESVVTTITDVGGATGNNTTLLKITDQPLQVSPAASGFSVVENGTTGSVLVATFTDSNPTPDANDFPPNGGTVVINWGDGSTSSGTVAKANGSCTSSCVYNVTGSHTYTGEEGTTDTVYATVTDAGGATANNMSNGITATITDASISVTPGANFSGTEGVAVAPFTVATLHDSNTSPDSSDFSAANAAVVNWGDGTTSNGSVAPISNCGTPCSNYNVTAGHTFAEKCTCSVTVTVTDAGGATNTGAASTAAIADGALTVTAANFNGPENVALTNQKVATLTDANPTPNLTDFTAGGGSVQITWGDGSTSNGSILLDPANSSCTSGCNYDVVGSHTYSHEESGSATVTAVVTDADGATANDNSAGATATFTDAAITVSSIAAGLSGTEGGALPAELVATFTDANPTPDSTDFTCTGSGTPSQTPACTVAAAVIDWGDGSSTTTGTIAKANGSCTASCTYNVTGGPHTYAEDGSFKVKVTITDAGGAAGNDNTAPTVATIADAALTVTKGANLSGTEGTAVPSGVIATFTDANATPDGTDFSAPGASVINWGDGTTSNGTIAKANGSCSSSCTYNVSAGHDYTEQGAFNIVVTVTDTGGATADDSAAPSTATISDATLTVTKAANFTANEGVALAGQVVATLTDANPTPDAAKDFGAGAITITWGDGGSSAGSAVLADPSCTSACTYNITGNHTYAEESGAPDSVSVTVTDAGGSTANDTAAPATATVADAPVTVSAVTGLTGTEGTALPATVVATFTDANPTPDATDFPATAAVINWGDGSSTSTGTIALANAACTSACTYNVSASHTYSEDGTNSISVTVTDAGGASGNDTAGPASIKVADAPLKVAAAGPLAATEGTALPSTVVATFTDANPTPDATDFSAANAAVINWGDGTGNSNGTIALANSSCTSACTYDISGAHTYAEEGKFSVSVTLTDAGGATADDTGAPAALTSADAALSVVKAATFSANEGASAANVLVATFTDANPAPDASDFSGAGAAVINWGDGTAQTPDTSAGTIGLANSGCTSSCTYNVTGSHTYPEEGSFPVAVTITDAGGATGSDTSSPALAAVADQPVTVSSVANLSEVENSSFTTVVATLVDSNPTPDTGDFGAGNAASIDWGDGSAATPGTISKHDSACSMSCTYDITGTHAYSSDETTTPFKIVATVTDAGGATSSDTSSPTGATIADGALTVTPVNASFPENLTSVETVAQLTDANPAPDASDFSGAGAISIDWGDGSSPTGGSLVLANPSCTSACVYDVQGSHSYGAEEGPTHQVKVTVTDAGGSTADDTASPATATVTDAALTVTKATDISGTEQQAIPATVVATFTDANPTPDASDFGGNSAAVINWGDGQTSAGAIALVNSSCTTSCVYSVSGAHTFADGGTYAVVTTVNDMGGATADDATAPLNAVIADAAITVSAAPGFSGVEGSANNNQLVATFSDANPTPAPGDFAASNAAVIAWGDGSTSNGSIALASPNCTTSCVYDVSGSHTYADEGTDSVVVTITDAGGATGADTSSPLSAVITDAALTAQGQSIVAHVGMPFTGPVATFTDANPSAPASDFSATINWGDGSPTSNATSFTEVGGTWNVNGTHTYASTCGCSISVLISDIGRSSASATTAVSFPSLPPLRVSALNVSATEGQSTGSTQVGGFTDPTDGTSQAPTAYTATINWGDGSQPTTGTVSPGGSGFSVFASHVYAETGSYPLSLSVVDVDGSGGAASASTTVVDAALSGAGINGTVSGTHVSPDAVFVNQAYEDLLHRAADSGGLSGALNFLGSGGSRSALAAALASSDEYRANLVTYDYQRYLSRSASSTDISNWQSLLAHGATDEQLIAALTGSFEYFQDSGSSNSGFVSALYQALLTRGPTSSEAASALTYLNGGGSRTQFAFNLLQGSEYRGLLVTGFYQNLLHRTPSAGEVGGWVGALGAGATDEAVQSSFVGSFEYFENTTDNAFVAFVNAAYRDVLGRAPDAPGLSGGLTYLASGGSRSGLAQILLGSPEYLGDAAGNAYVTYLGRSPAPSEVGGWVSLLSAGMRDETMLSQFAGSAEFFNDAGGNNTGFVDRAYQVILNRAADPAGMSGALSFLNGGGTRTQFAYILLTSSEYRGNLVKGYYQAYLGRTPSPGEISGWVNTLAGGVTDERVIAAFLGSEEYFAHRAAILQGATFSGPVARLSDAADPSGLDTAEYRTTIDWGDGSTPSAGTVIAAPGGGGFQITGNHAYSLAGQYTVTVSVADVHGSTATFTATMTAG